MIDSSLWESRSTAVMEIIRYYSIDTKEFVLIFLLGFLLMLSALLGYGFYLWHLRSSNEHSQSRLLNILNGYLSAACMTCSPSMLNMVLTLYLYKEFSNKEIENAKMSATRVSATHVIAISVLFLLISIATVLNHFKPGLYLDISLSWCHKIAIPLIIRIF